MDRPNITVGVAAQCTVSTNRNSGSLVIKSGVFSRQGFIISRIIYNDRIPVGYRRLWLRWVRLRYITVDFIKRKLELIIGRSVAAIICAPVVILCIPFHVVAANCVFDVIQTVAKVNEFPSGVDHAEIHT